GDDVFLMEKIRTRYPLGIRFAKAQEALVETHAAEGWSEFISQRLRWAGKMQLVRDWKLKCIPGLVWLQRAGTWSLLVFSGVVRDPVGLAVSGASLLVQWMADAGLQWKASRFYRIPRWSIWFLPMAVLHSFYFILLGLLTWLPVPLKWKGRRV
ncbi:MAG TPA: hypothetical protein VFX48_06955, partial [Saprospiraceae bacterium]|nr:hypothetical protein [Saprospiraceae bacterium]